MLTEEAIMIGALEAKVKRLETVNAELLAALDEIMPHAQHRIQGTTEGDPVLDRARTAIANARKGEK